MGVSKNKVTPKWMVKIMENPTKMDDLGGTPTIFGNIHILYLHICYLCFFSGWLCSFCHQRAHKPCAEDQSRKSRKAKSPRPTPRRTWEFHGSLGLFPSSIHGKIPWEKSHGKIWGETKKKRNTRMFLEGHGIFQWIEVIP